MCAVAIKLLGFGDLVAGATGVMNVAKELSGIT